MNLILVPEPSPDGTLTLTGHQAQHVRDVLRAAPGETVRVGVEDGPVGTGTVLHVAPEQVTLSCVFDRSTPPRPRVDLLLAVPRPKVLKRLWAQLAALGVGRIILTNAARVERPYFDTHILEPVVYRPLLIEGLQQARDTRVPLVSVHRQFRKLVEDDLDTLTDARLRLLADPGPHPPVATALTTAGSARVLIAVGPEGGWNDFERHLLVEHGCQPVSMGRRTLRTDTACISLLSLVHDAIGVAS